MYTHTKCGGGPYKTSMTSLKCLLSLRLKGHRFLRSSTYYARHVRSFNVYLKSIFKSSISRSQKCNTAWIFGPLGNYKDISLHIYNNFENMKYNFSFYGDRNCLGSSQWTAAQLFRVLMNMLVQINVPPQIFGKSSHSHSKFSIKTEGKLSNYF